MCIRDSFFTILMYCDGILQKSYDVIFWFEIWLSSSHDGRPRIVRSSHELISSVVQKCGAIMRKITTICICKNSIFPHYSQHCKWSELEKWGIYLFMYHQNIIKRYFHISSLDNSSCTDVSINCYLFNRQCVLGSLLYKWYTVENIWLLVTCANLKI